MSDIFISYSRGAKPLVVELAKDLEALEYSVWFDEKLAGGQDWWNEILATIRACKLFVFVITPGSVASDACHRELDYAVVLRRNILPVMLADTEARDLPETLRKIQFVDYREPNRQSLAALVKALNRLPEPAALPSELPPIPPAPLALEALRRPAQERTAAVLVVGTGVGEKVLLFNEEPQLGHKQTVREQQEMVGGSGVNYALRLGHTGYYSVPVLSIGDDWTGRAIQDQVMEVARHHQLIQYVNDDSFLCPHLSTPESIVLIAEGRRTIFTGHLMGFHHFGEHVRERLLRLDKLDEVAVRALMIGHIYADSSVFSPGREGQITRHLVERYADEGVLIFANLGRSQFELGNEFWARTLQKVTIFQLALDEARAFFREDKSVRSLREMLEWFQSYGITAVITMDRVGAIATLKDGRDGVIYARPYDLEERLVDTTGAGDAFGAGLVSYFLDQMAQQPPGQHSLDELLSISRFEEAIKRARVWAAYCCTTLGAANQCPDRVQLGRFEHSLQQTKAMIDRGTLNRFDDILWFIDRAH